MRIAIIGANGYLARNLLHAALAAGEHSVTAYGRAAAHADGYAEYTRVDLLDAASLAAIDLDVDVVYMMVGRTGTADGFDDYDAFIDANERTLLNLLAEYRRQGSTAKIVFPSTRLVYAGRPEALREDDPKEFKTVYAVGKYAAEQYLRQFNRVFGVRYAALRLCIPFGTMIEGASSYGTLEFMLAKARAGAPISLYGDGRLRRTFTHIADLADVLLRAGASPACENDVFNIGGRTYSLLEVATLVAAQHGVGIEHVEWPQLALALESGDTVFDDARLAAAIGPTEYLAVEEWLNDLGQNG